MHLGDWRGWDWLAHKTGVVISRVHKRCMCCMFLSLSRPVPMFAVAMEAVAAEWVAY